MSGRSSPTPYAYISPYCPENTMKIRRSTFIPAVLLIYLCVMSYIGYPEFQQGHYLYYFGVIGVTLVLIVILHFFLKKRERMKENRSN